LSTPGLSYQPLGVNIDSFADPSLDHPANMQACVIVSSLITSEVTRMWLFNPKR